MREEREYDQQRPQPRDEARPPRKRAREYRPDEPRRQCGNRIALPDCINVVFRWPCG